MQRNDDLSEDDSYAHDLLQHVSEHLGNQVQSLSIDISEEGITIDGICDSFHSKQLAQEIVSKSSSLRIVTNRIVVREPPK
jgi:hypothetical protein